MDEQLRSYMKTLTAVVLIGFSAVLLAQDRPMATPGGRYESRPNLGIESASRGAVMQAPRYWDSGCSQTLEQEKELNRLLKEKIAILEEQLAKMKPAPQAAGKK